MNGCENVEDHVQPGMLQVSKSDIFVGYLRESVNQWKKDWSQWVCYQSNWRGLYFTFKTEPQMVILKNNNNGEQNPDFVSEEIAKLISKGFVTECSGYGLNV